MGCTHLSSPACSVCGSWFSWAVWVPVGDSLQQGTVASGCLWKHRSSNGLALAPWHLQCSPAQWVHMCGAASTKASPREVTFVSFQQQGGTEHNVLQPCSPHEADDALEMPRAVGKGSCGSRNAHLQSLLAEMSSSVASLCRRWPAAVFKGIVGAAINTLCHGVVSVCASATNVAACTAKSFGWTWNSRYFLLTSLKPAPCTSLSWAQWIFCDQIMSLPVLPVNISCKMILSMIWV